MAFRRRQTGDDPAGFRALSASRARLESWLEAERGQLPLWLPVGIVAGIAAWFAFPDARIWGAFLAAMAALGLAGWAFGGGGRLGRALLLFAAAAILGCGLIWARAEWSAAPRLERPVVTEVTGRILKLEPLPAREAVRLLVAPDGETGLPGRLRITVPQEDAPPGLATGATVQLRARLVPPPSAAVPGAYDYAATAWFAGIGATGKAMGPVAVVAPAIPGGPARRLADARIALTRHILSRLLPGPAGVAAALATGDMGAVNEADNEAFRRSGLAHLLSVSGLHLTAAVGATMFLALRLLALWPWLALRAPLPLVAAGIGALTGIAYTMLTGAEVPTVRSLIAALVVLAGLALGREAMTLRMVAAGALLCLLLWPESAAGPSFQLSFAAILSIVAFHELPWTRRVFERREEGLVRRLLRQTASLLLTGLVVEAALAPIAIFHFHRAGLYGAAANIIAIPLTTFVIMPAEALALLLDMAGVGAPLWWLTGHALALLLWIAHHVGDLPGAVRFVPGMSRTAFALIVAGGLWLALWRTRARLAGLAPILIGSALALTASPPDLFVTGDGRHLAVRGEDGAIALLRERAGDYVRATLSELSGREADTVIALDDLPGARCSPDACEALLMRGGRGWRLLATRSAYRIDRAGLEPACAAADIVVSDRRLPVWCRPRWLKADPDLLRRTGGLAIRLAPAAVATVADLQGDHPWARTGSSPKGKDESAKPPSHEDEGTALRRTEDARDDRAGRVREDAPNQIRPGGWVHSAHPSPPQ